ncbi:uncharacterized protein L969DRAFT_87400 [Mixia osmundae IAM 14324]|uniref:L-type lectin-like domain-containing protein n=1 Tax=Mixia osmundae (strain CBS 9802 / IAM 14324 / JCM 22182 / KY 12970) TaxID=764103 RepID=G7EA89_MIXOS|nr:uncharacterized protein L969DRAFT_87400 [Mixia osmundae IAM 14324]KEI39441.1 hypothetical protein L969DRAFT_87400 [Mixia osmundae IAM 14324]GAA99749.1 hypothetical protein E5Q_06452 [Mixia osmundae IAM 14324]
MRPGAWRVCALLAAYASSAHAQDDASHFPDGATEFAEKIPNTVQVKLDQALSFKAPFVSTEGRIPNYDLSGHAAKLPMSNDYVRIVPPSLLSYGGAFSTKKSTTDEWIVEIAVRVHGSVPSRHIDQDGKLIENPGKGGRGLAFWYTKNSNPTFVTTPSDPRRHITPPPGPLPRLPNDPDDDHISFFGNGRRFEGLGVVLDTSPTQPLFPRSDARTWTPAKYPDVDPGPEPVGKVVGLLDDGSTDWIHQSSGEKGQDGSTLSYINNAFGDCMAPFRNAQGLFWIRVAYFDKSIRVDLDLKPHETLATADRHFSHHCFSLPDIVLPKGYYFGVTGLGNGRGESDSFDLYAMEVFGVYRGKDAVKQHAVPLDERDPLAGKEKLDGTSKFEDDQVGGAPVKSGSSDLDLAMEVMVSQKRMTEAIDDLTRRVESISGSVSAGSSGEPSAGTTDLMRRIESSLHALTSKHAGSSRTEFEVLIEVLGQTEGKLQQITQRIYDLDERLFKTILPMQHKLEEVERLTQTADRTARLAAAQARLRPPPQEASSMGTYLIIIAALLLIGLIIAMIVLRKGERGGRGKKMI